MILLWKTSFKITHQCCIINITTGDNYVMREISALARMKFVKMMPWYWIDYDVIKRIHFPRYRGPRWIPLTKTSDVELWCFLSRWLTSARAYRIGGRKLCPSVCLYVKRYLLLQFCTDYNQTWINMIWAVAAKTLLCQIFHKWRKIEVNCVYISRCVQLVSYFWNAGMHTK